MEDITNILIEGLETNFKSNGTIEQKKDSATNLINLWYAISKHLKDDTSRS